MSAHTVPKQGSELLYSFKLVSSGVATPTFSLAGKTEMLSNGDAF